MSVESLPARFWANVDKSGKCWIWTGRRMATGGYGGLAVSRGRSRPEYAHRISYELHFGSIPEGMFVCHRCDNPPCVRPDHLFLGAPVDNVLDMYAKGREHRPAVLSVAQVREIRRRYAAGGVSQTALAREFGVTRGATQKIVAGTRWKNT